MTSHVKRASRITCAASLVGLLIVALALAPATHSLALTSELLQSDALQSPILTDVTPISDMLVGKSADARATIKGEEIAKAATVGKHSRAGVTMDIQSVEKIDGGVQVFARAWKNEAPIGFGADGTVEIERFRVFNPPIMVPDGTKKVVTIEHPSGLPELTSEQEWDNMKEDPQEALLLSLAETMATVGKDGVNIQSGKVGNTTDTFYPQAGTGVTASDGWFYSENSSFATARGASASNSVNNSLTYLIAENSQNGSGSAVNYIERTIISWDTSAVPDGDTIGAATLSCFGTAKTSANPAYSVNIYDATPADPGTLVTDDYDQSGGLSSPTTYSTAITNTNWATTTWNDFALNASGIANINASGVSSFSLRSVEEVDNIEPTNGFTEFDCRAADQTGTTEEPKLVVVHSAAATGATSLRTNGQSNPTNLTGTTPDFSAIYNDPDASDVAASYQIQVATSSGFTSTYWDSGKTVLASSTPQGTRIADISYGGQALASSTTYHWRIKFWDVSDIAGALSTESATFSLAAANPTKVRKSINESLSNSISPQNDDELRLVLTANTTYIVDGIVFATSTSATPDILLQFTAPSGATLNIGYTTGADEEMLTSRP